MILDLLKLTDRIAIVTGAGKGIGRGCRTQGARQPIAVGGVATSSLAVVLSQRRAAGFAFAFRQPAAPFAAASRAARTDSLVWLKRIALRRSFSSSVCLRSPHSL